MLKQYDLTIKLIDLMVIKIYFDLNPIFVNPQNYKYFSLIVCQLGH